MNDVISRLRIKHTIYTTAAAGIILFILLSGFFGLLYGSANSSMSNALDDALAVHDDRPESAGSSRCFSFYIDNNIIYYSPIYSNDINFYEQNGYDVKEIAAKAVETEYGYFEVDDKFFAVKSAENTNGRLYYAVYDRTMDRNMLLSTVMIIICLYVISMMLIALIAYLFSAKTTAPLREAMQQQRDLVANASHELKTPLTVIATNLSVMKSEPTSTVADNAKWVESIDGQIARMDGLIKNMLELSKLEQSTIPKRILDLSQITEGACLEFEPLCFEKNIRLMSDIKPNILVFGDKDALERLVIILLDNAVKYCAKENGKIGCKLTADNKRIHLTVMNTGAAISADDAKHVFDRFYRSDGARENTDRNSFGLGLAIAQATVISHGGTITCHGVDNKGSVFDVFLPLPKKKELKLNEQRSLATRINLTGGDEVTAQPDTTPALNEAKNSAIIADGDPCVPNDENTKTTDVDTKTDGE